MIEINLLPEELKTKIKKTEQSAKNKKLLYIIPLVFSVLIIAHLFLVLLGLVKGIDLNRRRSELAKLEPNKTTLEKFRQDKQLFSQDTKQIEDILRKRINWSQKINRLSMDLPSGVWFTEVSSADKDFTIKGSVVSLEKAEMNLINEFIEKLRKDHDFYKNFTKIELVSAQRKMLAGYEIVEFTLSGEHK
ncbi:MAG: hypothetical protein C4533_04365 [Candidatus Omnitrophota bacterium]|jgi:Tfp pilus assembly protein PilN|nr:MAG: hypothetical protein C4533_04365 [Candidatus Omnitrophota bacterium]